jgi:hypothetical protein
MHFYLSANAATDLGRSVFTPAHGDHDEFSKHWYVHRVLIDRRKGFIVMEAHTRYALVFCGVTKPVLNKFPILFADYLWRHIVSLCEVDNGDFEHIKQMAANMCSEIQYHKGLNKSVQAHIKDAAQQLEYDLYQYGFPDEPGKEFYLSMRANRVPCSRYGEKGFIIPLNEFQRLWCEILGVAPAKE